MVVIYLFNEPFFICPIEIGWFVHWLQQWLFREHRKQLLTACYAACVLVNRWVSYVCVYIYLCLYTHTHTQWLSAMVFVFHEYYYKAHRANECSCPLDTHPLVTQGYRSPLLLVCFLLLPLRIFIQPDTL